MRLVAEKDVLSKLALGSKGTEPCKIQLTRSVANMLVAAVGAVLAESSRIPLALPLLRVGIHVKVQTLWVAALSILCKEPAFWHLFQIILVQKLAGVPLFAQTTKPVLAYDRLFFASGWCGVRVPLWTGCPARTAAPQEEAAQLARKRAVYIDSQSLFDKTFERKAYSLCRTEDKLLHLQL